MNLLSNYFQIQQNLRDLVQILLIPGWVLYNPTFESYIIKTKFQQNSIKKSDQKTQKWLDLMDYQKFIGSLKEHQVFGQ